MSENTPATSTDAATGAEGDADQLPAEDTLTDRGVDDLLDEGYTLPERPRPEVAHWGETPWEESHGESLDLRVAQEEPEVWDAEQRSDPNRAGRLSEDDDAVEAGGNDQFAVDAGIDGGAAGADMHVVDEES